MTRRQGLILAGVCAALLAACCRGVSALSHESDWQPSELVGLLLVLCIGSDVMTVEVRNVRITGSFLAIVLAMALLGPAPAAVIGASASVVDALLARRPLDNVADERRELHDLPAHRRDDHSHGRRSDRARRPRWL